MKNINYLLLVAFVSSFLNFSPVVAEGGVRKIVVWKDGVSGSDRGEQDNLIKKHGGFKHKDLDIIGGSVVLLSNETAVNLLKKNPKVLRVDDDVEVLALAKPVSIQAAQVLPWGVDRIDADLVWPTGNNANPIKVAVIDTGISKDHPDLKNNIKGGVNTIVSRKGWNDDNGHGSHVAGIIGALNDAVGVVGVAPLVDLYAVKVLGANGSGYLSDVIEGLQWSAANGMKVANMSLGTSSNIQSFHDAIIAARNAGVVLVAAAGNSGAAVGFPAAYPEVIAVSATDSNNNLASFSSRGPEVDLAAPGVSIYSAYKGSGYATLSGTSMASPHVAGSAALVLNTPVGAYDLDADGLWDPTEVQNKLQDRAGDLGAAGFDNLFGWGLVNAYQATQ